MAVLPVQFRKGAETSFASYTFTELASGSGFVVFYPINTYQGGAIGYQLIDRAVHPYTIADQASGSGNTNSSVAVQDLDFDLKFQKPQTIQGDAFINVPFAISNPDGTGTRQSNIKVLIRKWDGTTETEIANATGHTISRSSAGITKGIAALKITTPLTHFKTGEYLRITIQQFGWTDGNAASYGIAHDPYSGIATLNPNDPVGTYWTSSSDITTASAAIPFKILI